MTRGRAREEDDLVWNREEEPEAYRIEKELAEEEAEDWLNKLRTEKEMAEKEVENRLY
jgi:hypothetical protein